MKPPKNLVSPKDDAGEQKSAGRGFGGDSFRNYMARKIELQRSQFGLVLPPEPKEKPADCHTGPPKLPKSKRAAAERRTSGGTRKKRKLHRNSSPESTTSKNAITATDTETRTTRVRFSKNIEIFRIPSLPNTRKLIKRKRISKPIQIKPTMPIKPQKSGGLLNILERLQQKYKTESSSDDEENPSKRVATPEKETSIFMPREESADLIEKAFDKEDSSLNEGDGSDIFEDNAVQHTKSTKPERRSDLFFFGIVVLVNGYTEPDAGEIQRLLHRHGGDLEKYETGRVTHIIAEHLSTAKANIYRRQRRPTPVCRPQWIVDSVKAYRLLPFADYLLDEVRDDNIGKKTVKTFFASPEKHEPRETTKCNTVGQDRMSLGRNQECLHVVEESKEALECHEQLDEDILSSNGMPSAELITEIGRTTPLAGPGTLDKTPRAVEGYSLSGIGLNTSPQKEGEMKQKSPTKQDSSMIGGRIRTVGTDPHFLDSYFSSSRLSFIGSFKQRSKPSPTKNKWTRHAPRDSLHRFIFHVDMDCFFASVVLRNYPELRDTPVAISHNSSQNASKRSTSECATCNYEARKYGIKKGMFLGSARELCPDLVVLDYDFHGYEEVAEEVSNILNRHSEPYHGRVEQVSCDEAYMEMFLPLTASMKSPDDCAGDLAESIRKDIFSSTGCTASIGIAKNKLLAKLATDKVKPDKHMVVQNYRDILEPLRLRDLPGIGYKKDRDLTSEGLVTVRDVWDLGGKAESELIRILGNVTGKKIYMFCKGVDDSPIEPSNRKSIGAECNYGVRFDGPYGVDYMMSGLAKEVQKRMERVGVRGSRVTLKVKQRKEGAKPPPKFLGHGSCHNHSKSSDTIFTNDWQVIARIGMELFEELQIPKDDVRGMGIIVTKLDNEASSRGTGGVIAGSIQSFFTSKTKPTGTGKMGNDAQRPGVNCALASTSTKAMNKDPGEDQFVPDNRSKNKLNSANVEDEAISSASKGKTPKNAGKTVSSPLSVACLSEVDRRSFVEVDESVLSELSSHVREEILLESTLKDRRHQNSKTAVQEHNASTLDSRMLLTDGAILKGCQTECGDSTTTPLVDDDVELPPLDQIHMSQVMELPSPLRNQLISKLQPSVQHKGGSIQIQPGCGMESTETEESKAHSSREKRSPANKGVGNETADDGSARFRQVSVKRMMKLAAVKNGEESLTDSFGDSVSPTQLDCLPLELQLQIANNDDSRIGLLSPTKQREKATKKIAMPEKTLHVQGESISAESESLSLLENDVEECSEESTQCSEVLEVSQAEPQYVFCEEESGPQSFYEKQILPLKEWMDSHEPNTDDVCRMKDFLTVVVTEDRIDDAIKMLKSIRNRKDEWSDLHIYRGLLRAVEVTYLQVPFGGKLDSKWLGLL